MAYASSDLSANAAKRIAKNKKPADAGVSKTALRDIPNSRLYVELRELDLRIEQFSNRKKAEICDLSQEMDLKTRCLRLHCFNRHFHQGSTDPACPPSWSFYIYGHFVDHNQGTSTVPSQPAPSHTPVRTPLTAPSAGGADAERKLKAPADRFWTSAMASVQVRIEDPTNGAALPEVMRWERNRHVGQHKEMMEIHRVGAKPARIFVTMVRDFAPEYHRVTGALAAALSLSSGTRGQILRRLRQQAMAHSTPNPANPSIISADSPLKTLLGQTPLDVASLNQFIDPYLAPLEPVSLEYTIQLDGPSPSAPVCHDLEVAWSLRPAMLKLPAFLERLDVRQAVEAQDRKATDALSALKSAQRKRTFLMGFATEPVEFIRKLVAASAKEVREHGGNAVEMSAADNFKCPWAQEAAIHYLESLERSRNAGAGERPAAQAGP